jgi:hypothetical protein
MRDLHERSAMRHEADGKHTRGFPIELILIGAMSDGTPPR